MDRDTIVAISTPPGRGGIGIVRLSGPLAKSIVEPMVRLRGPMVGWRARFAEVLGDAGEVLDEAVVTYFAAPNSYTTEDVVEVAAHGAPVLLEAIMRLCLARGARLAEPGEFTRRAFLNGRLDLTQAEAVHDLISAHTLQQAKVAAAQLGGSLARTVGPVKVRLVELIAELEAGVDFAEDDLDLLAEAAIAERLAAIAEPLEVLERSFGPGRIVREGFTLALVGAPNAGKSSLFNALLERERAIVTAQPGTTRDPITEMVAIGGVPVQLVDTAGLRDAPEGEAEAQGIARSRQAMAEADLVLVVADGVVDEGLVAGLAGRPYLLVRSKSDLGGGTPADGEIATSSRTGAGLEELRGAILARVGVGAADSAMITNLRQHGSIAESVAALREAGRAMAASLPHEMLLLDLYAALAGLDGLTGATSQEDVLGLIFSRFCIGK